MRVFLKTSVSLVGLMVATSAYGGPLDSLFKSFAGKSNYTSPGSFSDQSAGYYTGGGFTLRSSSKTLNPIHISMPRLNASCGKGIDAYFGSFSFIKGEQMVQMLKNIGSQAVSYGFQLALKTIAPQLEGIMTQLRKIAQDANALAINDCNMVQSMFAAALPKGSAALEHACHDVSASGSSPDWFGAKEKCKKNQAEIDKSVEKYKEKAPDLMMGEYNLTWHALMKEPSLKSDPEMAEYILSVVGTLLSNKVEAGRYVVRSIEGRGDAEEFLKENMKGATVELLKCNDEDKCLKPQWKKVKVTTGVRKKMVEKIQMLLGSIRSKYLNKKAFTKEEMNFLQDAQKTPIYKYIQVSAAVNTPFIMEDAVDYMAVTLLLSQYEKFSTRVLSYIDQLQGIQLEDTQIENFKQNVQALRQRISQLQSRVDAGAHFRWLQMIKTYEQLVESRV